MSTLDDVVAAVRQSDDSGWTVADAIAALPEADDAGPLTNARIASYISERYPAEWSPGGVSAMRGTSTAWPSTARLRHMSFTAHRIMRAHPEKLIAWADKHPGEVLSTRAADALRPKGSIAAANKLDEFERLLRKVRDMIDDEPGRVLIVEQMCVDARKRHPRKIARAERTRDGVDLRAV